MIEEQAIKLYNMVLDYKIAIKIAELLIINSESTAKTIFWINVKNNLKEKENDRRTI